MDREEIAQSCLEQAGWAAKLGSPMYDALLRRIAADVRAGGPCFAALEPHMAWTRGLASNLLLAAIHRMVLEGGLPEAARFYPSMGGKADVDALWPHFLAAVPRAVLPASVQMNDVERSRALLPGFLDVVRRTALPLRLLEIGASAGLNLRWDHFPFLDVPATVRVIERRGCDLNPLDPTLDATRATLLSFIWPDQTSRFRQLVEALEIARRVPAPVDRSDAVPWLQSQLADPFPAAATVVFHSFFLPYLSEDTREDLRRIIEQAGQRATADAPVAWLSMEPGADVHLTVWPSGERRLIAQVAVGGTIRVVPDDTVHFTRRLSASPDRVFRAWTTAGLLSRWLAPKAECDARVGGHYRLAVTTPEGDHVVSGAYRELDSGRRIVKTWVYEGPMSPEGKMAALLTVDFKPDADGTQIEIQHEGLTSPAYATAIRSGAWPHALEQLEKLLADPAV
jgi:hypothetical protein